jgi:hypothetical protein
MWLACDHDCTDSSGRAWEAGTPQDVPLAEGSALLAIPGAGFTATGTPAPPEPEPETKPRPARGKAAPAKDSE